MQKFDGKQEQVRLPALASAEGAFAAAFFVPQD